MSGNMLDKVGNEFRRNTDLTHRLLVESNGQQPERHTKPRHREGTAPGVLMGGRPKSGEDIPEEAADLLRDYVRESATGTVDAPAVGIMSDEDVDETLPQVDSGGGDTGDDLPGGASITQTANLPAVRASYEHEGDPDSITNEGPNPFASAVEGLMDNPFTSTTGERANLFDPSEEPVDPYFSDDASAEDTDPDLDIKAIAEDVSGLGYEPTGGGGAPEVNGGEVDEREVPELAELEIQKPSKSGTDNQDISQGGDEFAYFNLLPSLTDNDLNDSGFAYANSLSDSDRAPQAEEDEQVSDDVARPAKPSGLNLPRRERPTPLPTTSSARPSSAAIMSKLEAELMEEQARVAGRQAANEQSQATVVPLETSTLSPLAKQTQEVPGPGTTLDLEAKESDKGEKSAQAKTAAAQPTDARINTVVDSGGEATEQVTEEVTYEEQLHSLRDAYDRQVKAWEALKATYDMVTEVYRNHIDLELVDWLIKFGGLAPEDEEILINFDKFRSSQLPKRTEGTIANIQAKFEEGSEKHHDMYLRNLGLMGEEFEDRARRVKDRVLVAENLLGVDSNGLTEESLAKFFDRLNTKFRLQKIRLASKVVAPKLSKIVDANLRDRSSFGRIEPGGTLDKLLRVNRWLATFSDFDLEEVNDTTIEMFERDMRGAISFTSPQLLIMSITEFSQELTRYRSQLEENLFSLEEEIDRYVDKRWFFKKNLKALKRKVQSVKNKVNGEQDMLIVAKAYIQLERDLKNYKRKRGALILGSVALTLAAAGSIVYAVQTADHEDSLIEETEAADVVDIPVTESSNPDVALLPDAEQSEAIDSGEVAEEMTSTVESGVDNEDGDDSLEGVEDESTVSVIDLDLIPAYASPSGRPVNASTASELQERLGERRVLAGSGIVRVMAASLDEGREGRVLVRNIETGIAEVSHRLRDTILVDTNQTGLVRIDGDVFYNILDRSGGPSYYYVHHAYVQHVVETAEVSPINVEGVSPEVSPEDSSLDIETAENQTNDSVQDLGPEYDRDASELASSLNDMFADEISSSNSSSSTFVDSPNWSQMIASKEEKLSVEDIIDNYVSDLQAVVESSIERHPENTIESREIDLSQVRTAGFTSPLNSIVSPQATIVRAPRSVSRPSVQLEAERPALAKTAYFPQQNLRPKYGDASTPPSVRPMVSSKSARRGRVVETHQDVQGTWPQNKQVKAENTSDVSRAGRDIQSKVEAAFNSEMAPNRKSYVQKPKGNIFDRVGRSISKIFKKLFGR